MKRVTLSRVKPMKGLLVLLVLIGTIHCVYLSEKYECCTLQYQTIFLFGRKCKQNFTFEELSSGFLANPKRIMIE